MQNFHLNQFSENSKLLVSVDAERFGDRGELVDVDVKASCIIQLADLLIPLVKDVEREASRLVRAFRRACVDAVGVELVHHVTHQARDKKSPRLKLETHNRIESATTAQCRT